MEDKAAAFAEHLAATTAQREAAQTARAAASELAADPKENVDAFVEQFDASLERIRADIAGAGEGPASDVAAAAASHFDVLMARHAEQNELLSAATGFLPPYQQRSRQQALAALRDDVAKARAAVLPKKKFSFRSKRAAKAAPAAVGAGGAAAAAAAAAGAGGAAPAADAAAAAGAPAPGAFVEARSLGGGRYSGASAMGAEIDSAFSVCGEQKERVIVRAPGSIDGHDFTITDVSDCAIYLLDVIGAMHIKRVRNCRIVIGAVRGSVHLAEVNGCVLCLACRQLRFHDSADTTVELRCASRPIVEECKELRFGPYGASFGARDGMLEAAGLAQLPDLGADVQDFLWLRQTHSPNWRMMSDEEAAACSDERDEAAFALAPAAATQ